MSHPHSEGFTEHGSFFLEEDFDPHSVVSPWEYEFKGTKLRRKKIVSR